MGIQAQQYDPSSPCPNLPHPPSSFEKNLVRCPPNSPRIVAHPAVRGFVDGLQKATFPSPSAIQTTVLPAFTLARFSAASPCDPSLGTRLPFPSPISKWYSSLRGFRNLSAKPEAKRFGHPNQKRCPQNKGQGNKDPKNVLGPDSIPDHAGDDGDKSIYRVLGESSQRAIVLDQRGQIDFGDGGPCAPHFREVRMLDGENWSAKLPQQNHGWPKILRRSDARRQTRSPSDNHSTGFSRNLNCGQITIVVPSSQLVAATRF